MSGQKVAVVTGASRGIGAAIARELGAQGINVVVNYARKADEAAGVVDFIEKKGGKAIAIRASVDSAGDLDCLFEQTLSKFGRLDILVNNAGIGATAPLDNVTGELIDAAFATNVKGMLLASQRAAKAFGADGGTIINISSALALQPTPAQAVYAASKAAIEAATRILAQELGPRKIRVNAVAPGPVETDLLPLDDGLRAFINSKTALGRVAQPADIAKVVAFVASDAAGWITGEVIGANGGLRI
jgi:3-oxoacyl-[acyl-carrier protein] reductase